MSLDRLLRGHLASSSRARSVPAGVTVRAGVRGEPVYSLTQTATAAADPSPGLQAELAAQRRARRG